MKWRRAVALSVCACLVGGNAAGSATVADFYTGRAITIVVGYDVGGGYDAAARLLSRHMSRHIPGHPSLIVQNMPGAGSLKAANYIYDVAPRDGTVLATVGRTVPLAPLFFPDVKFDATKFTWIGSPSRDALVCVSWLTSPVQSWADMLTKTYTIGGTGATSDTDVQAYALKNLFNAKIKLISPYPGTSDIDLAIERGEVDGVCGYSWSTLKLQHTDWLTAKKIRVLVQLALDKHPDLPDVPLITQFATNEQQLQIIKLIVGTQTMARPFFGPPRIPDDRAAALRQAFDETVKDAAFIAEAVAMHADVSLVTGGEIQDLLQRLYATPKPVIEAAARAMEK